MNPNETPAENLPVVKDPRTTLCTCKTAPYLMQLPYTHCPQCHSTYRGKKLTYPTRCARCQFNLFRWRLRNMIPEMKVDFL